MGPESPARREIDLRSSLRHLFVCEQGAALHLEKWLHLLWRIQNPFESKWIHAPSVSRVGLLPDHPHGYHIERILQLSPQEPRPVRRRQDQSVASPEVPHPSPRLAPVNSVPAPGPYLPFPRRSLGSCLCRSSRRPPQSHYRQQSSNAASFLHSTLRPKPCTIAESLGPHNAAKLPALPRRPLALTRRFWRRLSLVPKTEGMPRSRSASAIEIAGPPVAAPSAAEGSPRGTRPQTLLREFSCTPESVCRESPPSEKEGRQARSSRLPVIPLSGNSD